MKLPWPWTLCCEEEILDIDDIEEKVTLQLEDLMRNIVLDCTAAAKPATITSYRLAIEYYSTHLRFYVILNSPKYPLIMFFSESRFYLEATVSHA